MYLAQKGPGYRALFVAAAGASSVFAFAPFGLFPVAFLSIAVLVWTCADARSLRAGFGVGFAWGFGAFAAGISWLYIALNRYGGVPAPFAAGAIGLFCAYLALFPALTGALLVRFRCRSVVPGALLFAGLWALSEMLRGKLFTGFPWLAIGYSQTAPSPLAGYFPLLGVYGIGFLVALIAAYVALQIRSGEGSLKRRIPIVIFAVLSVFAVGKGLSNIRWTQPQGDPLVVSLIQTNFDQALKWSPEKLNDVLATNAELVKSYPADLVVLPETTVPMLEESLPAGYLDNLVLPLKSHGAALVLGLFRRDDFGRIFNSAMSVGAAPAQYYAKRHLVPFGEYSPPMMGWFYRLASIPMSDQSRGLSDQPPMNIAGQRVAINICYEDLFGEELIGSLPDATLMLNLSNLAWYGDSLAQPQHLQIARVRAMETGRPMLRATNTGMTAVIAPDGTVEEVLPAFERGALVMPVRGYVGMTPYGRWGDDIALALSVIALAAGWIFGRAKQSPP